MSGTPRPATRDPLRAVIRIRRAAVDDARRALAECLIDETARQAAAEGAEAVILRETDLASRLCGSDATVEAFGRWLSQAREAAARARAAHERAVLETGRSRAGLAAARAAFRVAEELQARRDAQRATEAERREQNTLDDLSNRRPRPDEEAEGERRSGM